VLVSASRFLHFQEPPIAEVTSGFPLRLFDLARSYERSVGPTNHLWIAMRLGTVREIRHVVPASTFRDKRAAAREDGTDVVSLDDRDIVLHHWGSRRAITAAVPSLAEPVVLVVDASYFEAGDPDELLRDLSRAGLGADLVLLCLAEDNPDVGPRGREGLAKFATLLEGGSRDGP
jgi:hypothetical protein